MNELDVQSLLLCMSFEMFIQFLNIYYNQICIEISL